MQVTERGWMTECPVSLDQVRRYLIVQPSAQGNDLARGLPKLVNDRIGADDAEWLAIGDRRDRAAPQSPEKGY